MCRSECVPALHAAKTVRRIISSGRPLSFDSLKASFLPDHPSSLVSPVGQPTAHSAVRVAVYQDACPDRTYRSARHSLEEHARHTAASCLCFQHLGPRLRRRRQERIHRRTETWRVEGHERHTAASCLYCQDPDARLRRRRQAQIRRRMEI